MTEYSGPRYITVQHRSKDPDIARQKMAGEIEGLLKDFSPLGGVSVVTEGDYFLTTQALLHKSVRDPEGGEG